MHAKWVIVSHGSAGDRWAWSGIPGGLAEGLASHGIHVTRISADLGPARERVGRAIARRIPGQSVNGLDAAWLASARDVRLRRMLASHAPDVVVTMGSSFGARLSPVLRQVTFEDLTVAQAPYPPSSAKQRWIKRQRRIYEASALCCVTTPWVKESLLRDYRVPDEKICIVGLGANVVCTPRLKDWDAPRILWVGVDWERKGGDILLEAFRRAAIPRATLDLVGQHPIVDIPGVRGHGIIRDQDRLRRFFEQATLFVLPSRFDPSPIVFLEAASAGTPCIGTRTAGTRYNVGPNGECIPPGDIDALVEAMRRMTHPPVAAAYRAAAIDHAKAHSWKAVAARLIDACNRPRWEFSRSGIHGRLSGSS